MLASQNSAFNEDPSSRDCVTDTKLEGAIAMAGVRMATDPPETATSLISMIRKTGYGSQMATRDQPRIHVLA